MIGFELFEVLAPFADMFAAVAFAASGALVASRKGLDVLGFMWLAVLTGVGGGTVRDLVLDVPVFWVVNPVHLTACLLTAVIVYLAAPWIESRRTLVLWFDALGLALVTIAGTAKGLDNGTGALVAIVMGVVTGSVGGIIRDLVGQERSVILRRDIYVTADALSLPWLNPAVIGVCVTFAVRGLAIRFNWSLPGYRRPAKASSETAGGENG